MDEPVYSPDGKFMWNGSEWIPTEELQEQSLLNERDVANRPPADSSIKVSDSVVMGDIHQQTHITQVDARGKNCPNCGATNIVIMKCQQEGCSNSFCEICNRECKLIEGPVVNQVHASGMNSLNRALFNSQSGTGPYCNDCSEKIVANHNFGIDHLIEKSRLEAREKAEVELLEMMDNHSLRLIEIEEQHKSPLLPLYLIPLLVIGWAVLIAATFDNYAFFGGCCLIIFSAPILLIFLEKLYTWRVGEKQHRLRATLAQEIDTRGILLRTPSLWDAAEGDFSSIDPKIRHLLQASGYINESAQVILRTQQMLKSEQICKEIEYKEWEAAKQKQDWLKKNYTGVTGLSKREEELLRRPRPPAP